MIEARTSERITRFCSYFSEKIGEIENVEHSLFRKILFMGIIDTLSRAGCPCAQRHRERVVTFIDKCSGWEDKDRVSALQLVWRLREEGRTCGDLYKLAKRTVDSWQEGGIVLPQSDLTFETVNATANDDERAFVNQATYKQLFYTYRNNLVHEFREPGYGMESSRDPPTPYYHGMIGSEPPWELVFPDAFIKRICMDCLRGLRELLLSQQRDPYESYQFGSLWR